MSRGKIKKFADRCESLQNRGNLVRYVVIFDMMRVQKRAVWLNALLSDLIVHFKRGGALYEMPALRYQL